MAAPSFPSPTKKWHSTTYEKLSPSRPELSAKGKFVVVTGGGTGIGAETARYFAQAGAARIALMGRRLQPLLDTKASIEGKYGTDVFVASTDVAKKHEVDAAFSKFASGGQIDILISNAAKTGPISAMKEVDATEHLDAIQENLSGSMHVAQAFLQHAAADAVVVNVSSSAAHVNYASGFSSYAVSKFAVYRLWDCAGFENPKMRIYHIQPGVVDTDMNRAVGGVKAIGYEDHVSLPASFMVWLASPEAVFLKSKFLWTNWDVDELMERAAEIEAGMELNVQVVGWPFGKTWAPAWNS